MSHGEIRSLFINIKCQQNQRHMCTGRVWSYIDVTYIQLHLSRFFESHCVNLIQSEDAHVRSMACTDKQRVCTTQNKQPAPAIFFVLRGTSKFNDFDWLTNLERVALFYDTSNADFCIVEATYTLHTLLSTTNNPGNNTNFADCRSIKVI